MEETFVEYDVVIAALGDTPLRVIQLVAQCNQWTLPLRLSGGCVPNCRL